MHVVAAPLPDAPSAPAAQPDVAAQFLLLEPDARSLAALVDELAQRGVAPDDVVACADVSAALQALTTRGRRPTVAFVAWRTETAPEQALVRALLAAGAYVVALLAPEHWESAVDAQRTGADDVLLKPCPQRAFGVRAMFAREALRRGGPSAWQRPRAVLREALAREGGGEVVIRGATTVTRIVVSHGRIAWVHDAANRDAPDTLLERLRAVGAGIDADDLSSVLEECRRTGEHFADVLARWGLVDRAAVVEATRTLVKSRLQEALSVPGAVAMFLPATRAVPARLGFGADEVGPARSTAPGRLELVRPSLPVLDAARVERLDTLVRDTAALQGCRSARVLHYGSTATVGEAGEAGSADMAWVLGAALSHAGDPRADAVLCAAGACYVARRLGADPEYFIHAEFDLGVTSLALARRDVAAIVERM